MLDLKKYNILNCVKDKKSRTMRLEILGGYDIS